MESNVNESLVQSEAPVTKALNEVQPKNPKWNKLSILSISIFIIWVSFLIFGRFLPNFPLTQPIAVLLFISFFTAPLIALVLGIISYIQIKNTNQKIKTQSQVQQTKEKGRLLSILIFIFIGIPVLFFIKTFLMVILYLLLGGSI